MSGRHDSSSKNYGLGGVFKSFTKSLKPASGRVPVVINAKVVGGGADMQGLLSKLQNGTLSTRVAAAEEITSSLSKHSVSSIPEIWYLARDLCDRRYAPSVRRIALNLMVQCITRDDIATVSNQLMYYRDIVKYCSLTELDPEFELFFTAVKTLTNDGKDIHDLCIYSSDRNWPEFMVQSLASVRQSIFNSHDKRVVVSPSVLLSMCSYLENCFKFNFSLLDESFVASVLDQISQLAFDVDSPDVLQSICELINVITVFGYVPQECYLPTFQLICWLSSFSPELHNTCSDSASRLFVASPYNALDAALASLQTPTLREYSDKNIGHAELKQKKKHKVLLTALGSLVMLESMLSRCGSDQIPEQISIAYDGLYWGLNECLSLNVMLLNSGVLRIFDHLFSATDDSQRFKRFSTLFPFFTWYSSSFSIIDLLSKARLNSSQDRSYWTAICSSIYEQYKAHGSLAPEEKIVHLFMLHPDCVDHDIVNFIIDTYSSENMCTSLHPFYVENCNALLKAFFCPTGTKSMPPGVRINVLKAIKDGFNKSLAFTDDDSSIKDTMLQIFKSSSNEEDQSVTDYILHHFLIDFLASSSMSVFRSVIDVFKPVSPFESRPKLDRAKTLASVGSFGTYANSHASTSQHNRRTSFASTLDEKKESPSASSLLNELAKSICSSFVTLSFEQPKKAQELFDFLIDLLRYSLRSEHNVALTIMRVLIRLRCTNDGSVYFSNPTDMDGLATAFKRNSEDESFEYNSGSLWKYPESIQFLPTASFDRPSPQLFIAPDEKSKTTSLNTSNSLDISKWIDIVLIIMEEHVHWELYSYVWAHICSQLFNIRLFWHLREDVAQIVTITCDQLTLNFPKSLSFPIPHSSVTKSDLQVAYIRTFSSLIGYHDLLSKQEEDNIVSSLLFGLSAWQKTAIPCIHMLTIACYEIPESLKKYLSPILSKLQTGTTNVFAGALILEFLMALTHVRSLTSNFTNEEFKQVFAISFRFIEHALHSRSRDHRKGDNESKNSVQIHGVDAQVDRKASTQTTTVNPILYSYLLVVSYSVVSRWFLSIDMSDRSKISSFIIGSVISSCDAKSVSDLDPIAIAFIDLISRFTYSNVPLKIVTNLNSRMASIMSDSEGRPLSRNKWILGHGIVEIITNTATGASTIILRRPSGISSFHLVLDASMVPSNTDVVASKQLISNSYLLLQLFKPSFQDSMSKPLPLPDDAFTERAINSFDRIPVVAHHKAGIVYIGPGQKEESEILANTVGSHNYQQFLDGLGKLIKLSASESFYVGGLDKVGGSDGEYAYFWSDEITHLIFHTTTLMPNVASDKMFHMKKRHIGNNYVNVFFDESNYPFNFNVIKSQFNFLNVVVSPHTLNQSMSNTTDRPIYKVKVFRRSGVPGIFSTTHYKLISLEQLPYLVRNIVIMANKFSDIWHNMGADGTYTSNWQLRVQQLNKLREKTIETQKQIAEEAAPVDIKSMEAVHKTTAEAFLEQLQVTDLSAYAHDPTNNDFDPKSENDLYSHLEFNSYT